jgi:type IV fimbrial biogenesis protein FimT
MQIGRVAFDTDSDRPSRGFTLTELMVAISILGTMLTLGFPSFRVWIANSQVRTTADVLQTGLRTAKAEAERRNRSVKFSFTDAAPALGATPSAGGSNWSLQTIAQFSEATAEYLAGGSLSDIANGVTITTTPAVASICFDSLGRMVTIAAASCTAAVQSIDVAKSGSDRPMRITVAVGGQVRMCDPKRPARSASSQDGC